MSIHTFTTLTHTDGPKYVTIRVTLDSYDSYQDGHIIFEEIQRECFGHINAPENLESRMKTLIKNILPEKEISIRGSYAASKDQTINGKVVFLPSGNYAIGGKIYGSVEPRTYEIRITMHGST